MEFVHFGDNSNETFKNTVVIEGWEALGMIVIMA